MSSGRPRVILNMHFFVSCQIDVDNKQHFSSLSWNNPLSKINFHSLIPLKRNSKTFYSDIKTIERVKKQTVSKKDDGFQG